MGWPRSYSVDCILKFSLIANKYLVKITCTTFLHRSRRFKGFSAVKQSCCMKKFRMTIFWYWIDEDLSTSAREAYEVHCHHYNVFYVRVTISINLNTTLGSVAYNILLFPACKVKIPVTPAWWQRIGITAKVMPQPSSYT